MSFAADYRKFLEAKACLDHGHGFPCDPEECHPDLKDHQKAVVAWAVRGGRRAIFASFGLGKTLMQLEAIKQTLIKSKGSRGLIVLPLNVVQEFIADAEIIGIEPSFVQEDREAMAPGIYLTNYESVREGKIDPTNFDALSLDEAAILRGMGGTKTFREFMRMFEGKGGYRFVATATPSPNDYIELLAYAAFLGVMDIGGAKTRFFKRNSEKADKLTLHPHKEAEFWLWVSSWALFLQKPSDLGFSDEGYELPPIDVRWHEIPTNHADASFRKSDGQGSLINSTLLGVVDASREKRNSLDGRIAKLLEIREEAPDDHRIIWHDLEDERRAIEASVPDVVSIYGSQGLKERTASIIDFSNGRIREIAGKPVMLGSGCNFQRHCHRAIYLGIGFKFADFIQSLHRLHRFLQKEPVIVDLIYTEAERDVRATLERKWAQHEELVAKMAEIIREYGLADGAKHGALKRGIGCDRAEVIGKNWSLVRNDCILECDQMESNSVDLILTSIPFSNQYEYSPNYADLGHTDDSQHFWEQMDFLIPNLLRILKPGRVAAIHVKDRITPSGISGMGRQTLSPFSDECSSAFRKHGFGQLARKTIVTDVVRENNQTYRLGWTEQCKDGSRMGNGMPEYLMVFFKPPTDTSNGYADEPVVKSKENYPLGRWQFDAHGFMRSSGERLLSPEDLVGLAHDEIFKAFRAHSLGNVYNFANDVALAEYLKSKGLLPTTFMLLQPQSWHEDVWTDIARMRTLNMLQARHGREMHLCPLQFDICDRAIEQYTMAGEVVFDPFAGLGSVPMRALSLGRIGKGCELSDQYFSDSIQYLKSEEQRLAVPTLFDLEESA